MLELFKAVGTYFTSDGAPVLKGLFSSSDKKGIKAAWFVAPIENRDRIAVDKDGSAQKFAMSALNGTGDYDILFANIQSIEQCVPDGGAAASGICVTEKDGGKHVLAVKGEQEAAALVAKLKEIVG